MQAKIKTCKSNRCNKPIYRVGLCDKHYEEQELKQKRKDDAVNVLHHSTIDGSFFTCEAIRNDFIRLQKLWFRVCDIVNDWTKSDTELNKEADFAVSWCVKLAQELVDAERAFRSNTQYDMTLLRHTQKELWDRYSHLEK